MKLLGCKKCSWHLLRLPLATSQRLASLLLMLMLVGLVVVLLVVLVLLLVLVVVVVVVVAVVCLRWTVDNPQARTALGRDGTATVFMVIVSMVSMISMVSMVSMVMNKHSRVVVD